MNYEKLNSHLKLDCYFIQSKTVLVNQIQDGTIYILSLTQVWILANQITQGFRLLLAFSAAQRQYQWKVMLFEICKLPISFGEK